jgi:hypothetical protein
MMLRGRWSKAMALALVAAGTVPASAAAALPSATTGAARSVTASSATLNGTVNPNNEPTTYFFQYGPTRAYGSQTPTQGPTAAARRNTPVSAGVSGLAAGTLYHYRLVATNPSGTRLGRDRTFTTLALISFTGRPGFVPFGSPTLLSGQLSGGSVANVRVTLRENPYPFTGFRAVATTRTDAAGRFAFNRTPPVNSRYQVVAATRPDTTSAIRVVYVRIRVSLSLSTTMPRSGQRVVFAGRASPAHNGRFVIIQRLVRGRWRAVRRTTLRPSLNPLFSRYRTSIAIRRGGLYRAHVGHDADHAPGSSSARRIRLR